MKSFTVRWRSARQHREYELFADAEATAHIMPALSDSGGMTVWQAGTLWKCPACGDRTLRIEEFLEGLRRAEIYLTRQIALQQREDEIRLNSSPALAWLAEVSAQMFGCERDRVYIKDESGDCTYGAETYFSRI